MFEKTKIKARIHNLTNRKIDLTDDPGSINDINKKIGNVIDDVEAFFVYGSRPMTTKLEAYKEPYQYNDNNLQNAGYYIQKEIDYLNRSLSMMDADDGGGGAW